MKDNNTTTQPDLTDSLPLCCVIPDRKDVSNMNLHERREREKNINHKCHHCGFNFKGWSSDDILNTYLSSKCPKCQKWNRYHYWGCNS